MLILDEPTSSLDVVSQEQILLLLKELKKKYKMTYILISHDLSVVHYMSDVIAVIFSQPKHPYTKALFGSIPSIEMDNLDEIVTLKGNVPSPINPPSGCYFHTRCECCNEKCKNEQPELQMGKDGRQLACWFVD